MKMIISSKYFLNLLVIKNTKIRKTETIVKALTTIISLAGSFDKESAIVHTRSAKNIIAVKILIILKDLILAYS